MCLVEDISFFRDSYNSLKFGISNPAINNFQFTNHYKAPLKESRNTMKLTETSFYGLVRKTAKVYDKS